MKKLGSKKEPAYARIKKLNDRLYEVKFKFSKVPIRMDINYLSQLLQNNQIRAKYLV